jgi:hypothetical protein
LFPKSLRSQFFPHIPGFFQNCGTAILTYQCAQVGE